MKYVKKLVIFNFIVLSITIYNLSSFANLVEFYKIQCQGDLDVYGKENGKNNNFTDKDAPLQLLLSNFDSDYYFLVNIRGSEFFNSIQISDDEHFAYDCGNEYKKIWCKKEAKGKKSNFMRFELDKMNGDFKGESVMNGENFFQNITFNFKCKLPNKKL